MKKTEKAKKDYIITYRSHEHYEVLGWVKASSASEAIADAGIKLKAEIGRYDVRDATVAEWRGAQNFSF